MIVAAPAVSPQQAERPHRGADGGPRLVACTLAVVAMIGGGKWGAHLGWPPLYIGDLLLAAAGLQAAVSALVGRNSSGARERRRYSVPICLLLTWALLRFIASPNSAQQIDALRDLAPYAYAVVALLAATSFTHASARERQRTFIFIKASLLFHLSWVAYARVALPSRFTGGSAEDLGSTLFSLRHDTDGTILGITGVVFLAEWARRRGAWRLGVALAAIGLMLAMPSRASLLASSLAIMLGLLLFGLASSTTTRASLLLLAPVLAGGALWTVPHSTPGQRLLTSIGITESKAAPNNAGAQGTTQARSLAWHRVWEYTSEDSQRRLVGVGFGPNFMRTSGADLLLLNGPSEVVRSPHNYVIGTYARLGLTGVGLLAAMTAMLLVGLWRGRRTLGQDGLTLFAAVTAPALLAASVFGVVLESPFGAIPFFWCFGIVMAASAPKPASNQEGARFASTAV